MARPSLEEVTELRCVDPLGVIEKAVRQKEYLLPATAEAKEGDFRAWCRANLQPGWYVTKRPGFMGGGSVLFVNDEMDIDLVTIGWGPANADQ